MAHTNATKVRTLTIEFKILYFIIFTPLSYYLYHHNKTLHIKKYHLTKRSILYTGWFIKFGYAYCNIAERT